MDALASALLLMLASPVCGGLLLAAIGDRRWAARLNQYVSLTTFLASLVLLTQMLGERTQTRFGELFVLDSLNAFLIFLTTFVGLTTSLFSEPYMRRERERRGLSGARLRLYKSTFQLFMAAMLLVLVSNNLGMLWVAMEAATLVTVLFVSLYRTPASLEAAWKYFILCGVGIALALFGIILIYFAAERVLGETGNALLWTELMSVRGRLEPGVMSLALVFFLVGFGTKAGLAPLHNWLPDAHAEGPTPVSAVLSGLLLNVAMYAILRVKVLADAPLGGAFSSRLLIGFGLLSLVLAAFFLLRQRELKRLFAYSSVEHMGITSLAFGLGGPLGNFAGLLHMCVHSLTKSALFFVVGQAIQRCRSYRIEDISGLLRSDPAIGWGLMLGTLAILGLPPFGVFASEFLIVSEALRQHPVVAVVMLLALAVAFAAILGKVQAMVFGPTLRKRLREDHAHVPLYLHLALVLMLGLWIPAPLRQWFEHAARLLGT